jgi:ABC-type sugar transport system permease subunit
VFFLPVVVTAGVVLMMQNDMLFSSTKTVLDTGSESLNSLKITDAIWKSLSSLKLDPRILNFVTAAVNKMYDITISSGVQILIFLAGLQTISPSLYEASSIEGATAWENLWKITVPIISPIILVNSVYTVIDAMGNLTNPIIRKLYEEAFVRSNYGFSSAMGWIYYVLIFICIGIVIGVISKMVYYENE